MLKLGHNLALKLSIIPPASSFPTPPQLHHTHTRSDVSSESKNLKKKIQLLKRHIIILSANMDENFPWALPKADTVWGTSSGLHTQG